MCGGEPILALMSPKSDKDEGHDAPASEGRAENRWDVRPLERLEFGYTPTAPTGPPPNGDSGPTKAKRRRAKRRRTTRN